MLKGAVLRALADVTWMAFPFVAKMKFILIIFFRLFLKQSSFITFTFEADREDKGCGSLANPEDHIVGLDWCWFANTGLFNCHTSDSR